MQHDITLTRGPVRLRPLVLGDAAALRALVDEGIWAGMSGPLPRTDAEMTAHLAELTGSPALYGFTVEHDGTVVGRTAFYDLVPGLRVEIGHTFYARDQWGSTLNPTVKLLLLDHAFAAFSVARVALRCDSRNTRSRGAIQRLGATYEGTLRRFRRAADGTIADAAYFSIIAEEYPAVREGLLGRIDQ